MDYDVALRLEKKGKLKEVSDFTEKNECNRKDSFNPSASICIKLLLVTCSKPAKVMPKQSPSAISMSLFCGIKLFKVIHLVKRIEFSLEFFFNLFI